MQSEIAIVNFHFYNPTVMQVKRNVADRLLYQFHSFSSSLSLFF
ncbi:hypothetical protein BBD26_1148 [Lactobacillus delbrueckii subsp. bulgaricus]|nr:hypothetical protein BBD26_1148 [Lactobacillus delbrueckii subsp. bulgaricus]